MCRFSETTKNSAAAASNSTPINALPRRRQKTRAKQSLAGERQQQQTEDGNDEGDGVGRHALKPLATSVARVCSHVLSPLANG